MKFEVDAFVACLETALLSDADNAILIVA